MTFFCMKYAILNIFQGHHKILSQKVFGQILTCLNKITNSMESREKSSYIPLEKLIINTLSIHISQFSD